MPEIEDECIFDINSNSIEFKTKTNGDTLILSKLELTKEQAASLAWLVNCDDNLKVKIKKVV